MRNALALAVLLAAPVRAEHPSFYINCAAHLLGAAQDWGSPRWGWDFFYAGPDGYALIVPLHQGQWAVADSAGLYLFEVDPAAAEMPHGGYFRAKIGLPEGRTVSGYFRDERLVAVHDAAVEREVPEKDRRWYNSSKERMYLARAGGFNIPNGAGTDFIPTAVSPLLEAGDIAAASRAIERELKTVLESAPDAAVATERGTQLRNLRRQSAEFAAVYFSQLRAKQLLLPEKPELAEEIRHIEYYLDHARKTEERMGRWLGEEMAALAPTLGETNRALEQCGRIPALSFTAAREGSRLERLLSGRDR